MRGFEVRTTNTFTRHDIDEHDGDAERVAQFTRANWNLPIGPVRSLIHAIESAGGLVFKFSFGTVDIDAMSQWPDDMPPMFFINADAPADRIRFSLAHELGHVVMHRAASETMEEEADRFAAEFLMPARDIAPHLSGMSVPKAAALKPHWRASMWTIIRRAKDTGQIAVPEYTALCRRMSALGYRKREPGPIPGEEPQFVPSLLDAYRASNGYTDADLARLSRVHEAEFTSRFVPRAAGLRIAN